MHTQNFSPAFPYHRIVIIGTTGSGKSTLAEQLAARFDLDCVELDSLNWQPGWVNAPQEEFQARVELATRAPAWVVAGNYGTVRTITWTRAEAVIWLDYPLPLILWRLLKRSVQRWWTKELLWGTNYERLWPHFMLWSDESLFKWAFKTYWRRKREYPLLFQQAEYSHLKVYKFNTPRETQDWLASI
jgi:adenylate kinase family enzyme